VVADWGFHPTDTYPADGVVIGQPQFTTTSTVRIFHYGPIVDTVFDDLKIEERPIGGGVWTDRTDDFEFSFDANDARVLEIDPKNGEQWNSGNDYRITHEAGDLKIPADVVIGGADVEIDAYVYEFCFAS